MLTTIHAHRLPAGHGNEGKVSARTLLAVGAAALAGCAPLAVHEHASVDFNPHKALSALCSTEPRPTDAALGEALRWPADEIQRWRRARSLDPEQVCRLDAPRLARSLAKAALGADPTGGDGARLYNEGFFRSDDGSVQEDGKFLALMGREALLAPQLKAGGLSAQSWVSLGPERQAGRMRALHFDRVDPRRVYVGSATGGVWISSDEGVSWAPVNDFSASLAISSITQSEVDPAVLYATTGEWSQGFRGAGLLRSTDWGQSWTPVPSTNPSTSTNWRYSQSIVIDPANPDVLLASNWCGIVRSENAGGSWTSAFANRLIGSSGTTCWPAFRLAFHPTDPSIVLAGLTQRSVARSADGGRTFARIQLGTAPASGGDGVVDLAVSRSDPSIWFASVNENSGDVYRSSDAGATWDKVANPEHLGTQGNYGNVIWVDPTDAAHVVVGGIDLHRSLDSGSTWTKVSDWVRGYRSGGGGGTDSTVSAHADHHVIVSSPGYNGSSDRRVFFGTDGGLYRQSDMRTAAATRGWVPLTTGMRTTQFYRVSAATFPATGLAVAGGTQDNSWQYLAPGSSTWLQPTTGDGGPIYFDPQNANRLFASFQYLSISRYSPPGVFNSSICQGITEVSKSCADGDKQYTNFIAPFVVNSLNGEQILAGAASLWLTENARSGSPPAWRVVKPAQVDSEGVPTNFINAIAQRIDAPQVVYVGHENGQLFSSPNAFDVSPAWVRRDVTGMPARRVTQIVIDRVNPSRVFALYAGYNADNVWVSDDAGSTWRNVAAGLPAAPVYSLAIRPGASNTLYVGTEVGLFVTENGGASWSTTNDGPAAVAVRDLAFASNETLIAATFGRGVWKASVGASSAADPTGLWWSPGENGWGMNFNLQNGLLFGALYTYDSDGSPLWLVLSVGQGSGGSYTGPLYRATGPAFNASPWVWNPATQLQQVGTMTASFGSSDTGTLSYSVSGSVVSKTITRFRFGTPPYTSCVSTSGSRAGLTNYQDLWENAPRGSEPGWGLNVAHEDDIISANLYTYDATGKGLWLILSNAPKQPDGSYTGALYSVRGPVFNTNPWPAAGTVVNQVGTMTLRFTNGETGTMSYTVNGVSVSKAITRSTFAPTARPSCS